MDPQGALKRKANSKARGGSRHLSYSVTPCCGPRGPTVLLVCVCRSDVRPYRAVRGMVSPWAVGRQERVAKGWAQTKVAI